MALAQLDQASEYVRAWAIQLMLEDKNPSAAILNELARLARNDPSPFVRLYVAAALQRTPMNQRLEALEGLLSHAEDAPDHNLPLMYWYAAEPVVAQDTKLAVALMTKTKIPLVRQFITRRMASFDKVASASR
jgi:HEAT repeat protein